LFERGVRVHVLNMGIIENTPTGRLIITIFSGFAEFERDMIVQRTLEGKAIAKQRDDFREGRPKKFSRKQIEHALGLLGEHSCQLAGGKVLWIGLNYSIIMTIGRWRRSSRTAGSRLKRIPMSITGLGNGT
jgi:DNA invertase Pin-like site-specific DNA recombinase